MTLSVAPGPDPSQTTAASYLGQGARIGVFDSGLGGLSVLRAIRQHLPQAWLGYVADSAYAPYGEQDEGYIAARCDVISRFLLAQGVDTIVVACNTATAAAVHILRAQYPHLPIIGVEPGVKPAVALSVNKRVGVLATPGTLSSDKFKHLIATHGQQALIVTQGCPGLAKEIEQGQLDTPRLRALVDDFCQKLKLADVDTAVLGCTHYPFVAPLFQSALGAGVTIVDTSDAVARHTADSCRIRHARLIHQAEAERAATLSGSVSTQLWTSGDPAHLRDVARNWLALDAHAGLLT